MQQNMYDPRLAQAQHAHAQAQAQAHLMAQQQQSQAMAAQSAAARAAATQRKPPMPPLSALVPPPPDQDSSPHADILDVLSTRQLAINRLARNHDLFANVFDPWKVDDVLAGKKRKRDVEDLARSGRDVLAGGVPGVGKEGPLALLANGAVRYKGERIELDKRRERLEKMLEETRQETETMERQFEETKALFDDKDSPEPAEA